MKPTNVRIQPDITSNTNLHHSDQELCFLLLEWEKRLAKRLERQANELPLVSQS